MYKGVGCSRRVIGVALTVFANILLPRHAQAKPDGWLGRAINGGIVPSLSVEYQGVQSFHRQPASPATAADALPALPYGPRRTARPLASIGRVTLPGNALTGSRDVWGVSFDLDDATRAFGQSLTVLAGAAPPTAENPGLSNGYATALDWTRNLSSVGRLDMSVLFSQPTGPDQHGQWLARVGSHITPLPFLPNVSVETEMAMACGGDAAQTQSGGNLGSLIKVIGSPGKSLHYQITLSRFDAGFQPQGFVLQSGRQAVAANVHYRFSSNVDLEASTEYAEENFEGTDPYRRSITTLTLSGPLFHAYMPALSAVLKTSSEIDADSLGTLAMGTRRLAVDLAQPLWDGWRSRFSVAMNQTVDGIGTQSFNSRAFRLAGNHRLNLGRFSGSIGPGMALRIRNGFEAHQDIEVGAAVKLRSRAQSLALDLGYLAQSGMPGVYDNSSVKVGLNYSLHFNGPAPAGDDNAWYLSEADGF